MLPFSTFQTIIVLSPLPEIIIFELELIVRQLIPPLWPRSYIIGKSLVKSVKSHILIYFSRIVTKNNSLGEKYVRQASV